MDAKLIHPEDGRFLQHEPDPDFSPERTRALIKRTVEKTNKFYKTLHKATEDSLGERVDILTSYAMHTLNGKNEGKTLEQYLGRSLYTKVVGEKILQKVRLIQEADRLAGTKTKKFQTNF